MPGVGSDNKIDNGAHLNAAAGLERLKALLSGTRSAVIALSGGADSTFLAFVASGLPQLRVIAVTVITPYSIMSESDEAARFCRLTGITHRQVRAEPPPVVMTNPDNRCYICKKAIMEAVTALAHDEGIRTVFDGTNADDMNDHRPGLKALKEAGVRSPLAEAGLTREQIRTLSLEAGLESGGKPSNSCLLTRFPTGTPVSDRELRRVERAEEIVAGAGFRGARVRVHGELVRIELHGSQFSLMAEENKRREIASKLKELGYRYVAIDAEGYRSGSMD